MSITQEQIDNITNAPSYYAAATVAPKSTGIRTEYIKAILGYRAVGGYFQPTQHNIYLKFVDAWSVANGLPAPEKRYGYVVCPACNLHTCRGDCK